MEAKMAVFGSMATVTRTVEVNSDEKGGKDMGVEGWHGKSEQ